MPKKNKIIIIFLSLNVLLFGWHLFTSYPHLSASPAFFKFPPRVQAKNNPLPPLSTPYYLIIDPVDNHIVAASRHQDRIYPASVTKLATALTALNLYPLDEVISTRAYSVGKTMNLLEGEKVTVSTLVSGLLIYSANDAAYNLALHYPGSESAFVNQMNLLVKKYGLTNTHFTNYDGLHDPAHYSTLYDLSQIARLSLKLPTIVSAAKTIASELSSVNGQIKHPVINTNELLGKTPEIEGLKTGWTPEAGGCFIGLVNLDGHYLLTLLAQSQDRFVDTTKLITWAKENVHWEYQDY